MSFRIKIVIGLVVIQLLLLLILVWSSLNFLRTSNEVELSNYASSTASVLASTTRPAVLDRNKDALQSLAYEILAHPNTAYVRFRDLEGVLVEVGDPVALARPFEEDFLVEDVSDGIFDVMAEITEGGVVFGYVELGFSTRTISSVMRAARKETATISVIGMGVSVLFSLILGNYFARQLKSLRDASRRIASGDIGYQLTVAGSDELAQTANAFNTMSRRLAALYSEKQAALNGARQTAVDLRTSERRIHAVLNTALDGIITIGELAEVETYNPAAEAIFGYEPTEVIGNSVNMLLSEAQFAGEEDLRHYAEASGKRAGGARTELIGKRKDGTTFPMEFDISQVQLEGRILYIGLIRDITERKRAETELRRAKDTALESARSKFEFIANVSQVIRSPVDDILSSINLMLDSALNKTQRDQVHRISRAGDALITIMNDVLDFSKIEAGSLLLENIDFDLHRTVDVVSQMLRPRAAEKGLDFTYLVPCCVDAGLQGDPTRLRQVLINLVDNAIKFTDEGKVMLRVSAVAESPTSLGLRFEVSDTGPGMSPTVQQRIFELFTGPQEEEAPQYGGGPGLGLVISKRLVEMMGGEIGVTSEPGKGSTFWFTVTLARQVPVARVLSTSYDDLRDLKVLVAVANPSQRDALTQILTDIGMRARGVEDASHAIDELCIGASKGQRYDLVVFDMNLPGMSGLQMARAIRSDARIALVRMVMVTTTGYRGESDEVRRAGISGYLTSPIEKSLLYDCVSAVMRLEPGDHDTFITRHQLAAMRGMHKGHVLLVCDDPQDQQSLAGALEKLDYRVSVAGSSAEVTEATKRIRYDYVLMEEHLPGIDAGALTRHIRDHEHDGRHTPVFVIMSSSVAANDQDKCIDNGADGCLVKPVEPTELERLLG